MNPKAITKAHLRQVADRLGITMSVLVDDALRFYWGDADPLLERRQQRATEASEHIRSHGPAGGAPVQREQDDDDDNAGEMWKGFKRS